MAKTWPGFAADGAGCKNREPQNEIETKRENMTALPFFEMLRSRALWAGTLVLLALAAQIVTAQDNSQKIEPAVPGANVTEARTNLTGQMPEGNGAQSQKPPSSGNGRMVTGKVVFADTNAPTDLIQAQATFHSGVTFKMLDQLQ